MAIPCPRARRCRPFPPPRDACVRVCVWRGGGRRTERTGVGRGGGLEGRRSTGRPLVAADGSMPYPPAGTPASGHRPPPRASRTSASLAAAPPRPCRRARTAAAAPPPSHPPCARPSAWWRRRRQCCRCDQPGGQRRANPGRGELRTPGAERKEV
eukprot:313180-Chlamydomonas_euryale.AAC.1